MNLLKASSDADAPARRACEPARTHKRSPHGAFQPCVAKTETNDFSLSPRSSVGSFSVSHIPQSPPASTFFFFLYSRGVAAPS